MRNKVNDNLSVLAIIPARGGSKRIPGKNTRKLNEIPLIAYTIQAALATSAIERVIVSTDDQIIAKVALKYGAEVPFIRPVSLAQDGTPDQPVLCHTLDWLEENENYVPDIILHLRPTTPFKTPALLTQVIDRMHHDPEINLVSTMTKCEGVFHPYWMYSTAKNGWAELFIEGVKISEYYQSQLLPPAYRLNGVVDAIRPHILYQSNRYREEKNTALVEVSEQIAMDIDTEFDFQMCEMIIQLQSHQSC